MVTTVEAPWTRESIKRLAAHEAGHVVAFASHGIRAGAFLCEGPLRSMRGLTIPHTRVPGRLQKAIGYAGVAGECFSVSTALGLRRRLTPDDVVDFIRKQVVKPSDSDWRYAAPDSRLRFCAKAVGKALAAIQQNPQLFDWCVQQLRREWVVTPDDVDHAADRFKRRKPCFSTAS